MNVLIQAGHVGIADNCDHGLRDQTGAPGEADYNARVAAAVAGGLEANGFVVVVGDANANCDPKITNTDWFAAVALHCDGRDASGFCCNTGNPEQDGAAQASANLADALRQVYGGLGLPDLSPAFANDENITEYYLFNSLTPGTPFVLLEMGAIADAAGGDGPDKLYLESHVDAVAGAIVAGVQQFHVATGSATAAAEDVQGGQGTQPADAGVAGMPRTTPNVADANTNLGQAIQYVTELLADPFRDDPTVQAVLQLLHAARKALGGE